MSEITVVCVVAHSKSNLNLKPIIMELKTVLVLKAEGFVWCKCRLFASAWRVDYALEVVTNILIFCSYCFQWA